MKPRLISPQAAFNRLRPHLKGDGWVTCASLDAEMRTGFLPLYGNGELLTPTEIADLLLYVRVEVTPTGQFICTIASHLPPRIRRFIKVDDRHPVQMVTVEYMPPPKWEFGSDAIEKLVRRTRGVHETVHRAYWNVRVEEEIRDLASKYSPLLENFGALYSHLEDLLREGGIPRGKNNSRFHKAIRDLVSKYRGKP